MIYRWFPYYRAYVRGAHLSQIPIRMIFWVMNKLLERPFGALLIFKGHQCVMFSNMLHPITFRHDFWKFHTVLFINSSQPFGNHFADDSFNHIFVNENVRIPVQCSLQLASKCSIDNKSALVQVMAWRRTGDKPLSEPMLTHMCGTRRRWIKNKNKIKITKPAYVTSLNSGKRGWLSLSI